MAVGAYDPEWAGVDHSSYGEFSARLDLAVDACHHPDAVRRSYLVLNRGTSLVKK